jgi:glycosyltransferase involved in cell wall biosynthesis
VLVKSVGFVYAGLPGLALATALHYLGNMVAMCLVLERRLVATQAAAQAPAQVPDVVFVMPPERAQGWILDAICREVGARLPGRTVLYHRFGTPLPPARHYFFAHYMYFVNSPPVRGRSYVFATHLEPGKHGIDNRRLARLLARADSLVCMNSGLRAQLAALGVPEDKLSVVVGAADSERFTAHVRRPDGKVGFSSAYYERKAPELILEIVRRLPHRRFVLLGKGWKAWPRFAELAAQPNFEYLETDYANYASHYAQMSVFVSPSRLEGGPIPLLEAMMANVVPVASRTGFAPDVIRHGENGYLFNLDTSAAEICRLIEQAFCLQADVHDSVRHCDFDSFAARIAHGLR